MRIFILMMQFFTRIPLKINLKTGEGDFAKGIVYLPIVGLIIGLFNAAVYYGAYKAIDGALPVMLYLLANTIITGALHIDGLADTCDGIFSSRTKDRMLEIMRDSRVGTNGAIAIVFDYLLRYGTLINLSPKTGLYAILLSPVASRTVMGFLMCISKSARSGEGLGGLFLEKVSAVRLVLSLLIGGLVLFATLKYIGLGLLGVCILVGLIYKYIIYSKIDGMTGDTLGGANEVVEILFLVAVQIAWKYAIL